MDETIRKNSLFSVNQLLRQIACLAIIFILFTLPVDAVEEDSSSGMKELLLKDIDELSEIIIQEYISLASKTPQKVWETPAAAYVITATDISRSAATNIPDLLRMVPGLFVGNADSSTWLVSSRGLANEYCVDLLVLIDGRQVNYLNWGGVFWSIQDYPLEDIERIEIIRGPGGTLWGTNSGNGVINVITKHAKYSQGGLISGVAGTDLYKSVFRYGGKISENAFYRVYGAYKDVDSNNTVDGKDFVDDWSLGHAGFRIDWELSEQDALTFQGDARKDDVWVSWPNVYIPPELYQVKNRYEKDKKNLDFLVQWDHAYDDGSRMKWLTYYDYFSLDHDIVVNVNYHTFKTDFEYQFTPFPNHDFIVGSGYRLVSDDIHNGFCTYDPLHSNDQTFTAFFQDNFTIVEDKLRLLYGSQFQYSDYSDFDYQPSVKLIYTPYEQYTLWASIARSAQHYYKGHSDEEFFMYTLDYPYQGSMIPMLLQLQNGDRLKSESILSFELGQRLQASRKLSFDLSAFYTLIDDYATIDGDYSNPTLYTNPIMYYIVDGYSHNNITGETYGVELAANAQITDYWKLTTSYSALEIQLHRKNNSNDLLFYFLEDSSPHHQIKINSYFDITRDVKLDASYYWIDEINNWRIPQHGRLDIRLGWKPSDNFEISVVGTNLLDDQTHEANGWYTKYSEVERGVYAKLTYRF